MSVALSVRATPLPYGKTWAEMLRLTEARREDRIPDTLLLRRHEPVVTLGRFADEDGLRVCAGTLERMGVALHRVERGGQATYHGPGQWVGYPILKLRPMGLGVRRYIHRLEEVMIRAAGSFGVAATRREGRPGVYCDAGKLGALGVAVRGGVSFHGFAFNVSTDLDASRLIVPCGDENGRAASLASVLGKSPGMAAARDALRSAFTDVFETELIPLEGFPPFAPEADHLDAAERC